MKTQTFKAKDVKSAINLVNDEFGESGKPVELLDKYGLGVKNIVEAVKKAISRKNA